MIYEGNSNFVGTINTLFYLQSLGVLLSSSFAAATDNRSALVMLLIDGNCTYFL